VGAVNTELVRMEGRYQDDRWGREELCDETG